MGKTNEPKIQQDRYTLTDNDTGESVKLARITPTYGKPGIDFGGPITAAKGPVKGGLRAVFGVEAHDPAYISTSHCLSEITYIDGDKGVLLHRGYNIKDLTENSTYMETVHLLLEGALPNQSQKEAFERDMVAAMEVPAHIGKIISTFSRDDAPMDILAAAVSECRFLFRHRDGRHGYGARALYPDLRRRARIRLDGAGRRAG